ncbi:asparagine synthase (glutamine-hydrolyzing) [Alcanivorax sp. CY1518]|uniref:asparagine synthase (glutamine-hydrolyzing) n=1 Tax=Alcanivorax quisquiliarum TaxID=2933565 RepID=A0ABT0E2W4_9GAMM|nr:asparagine synthase (glutamine-hydrolyzing) [Alcanivorax quisquiliarum]
MFIGKKSGDEVKYVLTEMISTLNHRGPDGAGVWVDQSSRFGMAHARLSINDLTEAGAQPMISRCKRYVISFNGEIYNHISLREKLGSRVGGIPWVGHSDTETLLELFSVLGVDRALNEIKGMFSIVLYDVLDNAIYLIRDRIGEKPLYWGAQNGRFFCASELKSIIRSPLFKGEINRDALELYTNYGYVPSPYSIYADLQKLPPGCYLKFKVTDIDSGITPKLTRYWDLVAISKLKKKEMSEKSFTHISGEVEERLRNAVSSQLMSDVPLGAFLSGGVDSSLIVALMQQESPNPIKTFTIGSCDKAYNEAEHAREVAKFIGTDHTELYISEKEMLDVLPGISDVYCEPFADSSQIPTMMVSELAKTKVSVALSGDGADEIFGGYNRYLEGYALWKATQSIHGSLRRSGARIIEALPPKFIDLLFSRLGPMLPAKFRVRNPGDKAHKLAGALLADTLDEYYSSLVCHWGADSNIFVSGRQDFSFGSSFSDFSGFDPREIMMVTDAITYLPDDIMTKVDRAAMAYGLEVRAPFLDHELVELSLGIPLKFKISGNCGKVVLRDILYKHVPKALIERPKTGFGIPLAEWLRGPLREWAHYCLDDERIRQQGLFDPHMVRKAWEEHLQGKRNNSQKLWNIICFQAWMEGKDFG